MEEQTMKKVIEFIERETDKLFERTGGVGMDREKILSELTTKDSILKHTVWQAIVLYDNGYTCGCCQHDWEERTVWGTKPEAITWVKNELFYFVTPEATLFAPNPKPEAFERLCCNAHCLCQEARKSDYTGPDCPRDAYRCRADISPIYAYPLSGGTLKYGNESHRDLGLTLEDLNRKD